MSEQELNRRIAGLLRQRAEQCRVGARAMTEVAREVEAGYHANGLHIQAVLDDYGIAWPLGYQDIVDMFNRQATR